MSKNKDLNWILETPPSSAIGWKKEMATPKIHTIGSNESLNAMLLFQAGRFSAAETNIVFEWHNQDCKEG